MYLKKLQNGSDIRGIALPGKTGEQPDLSETESKRLTLGFIHFLSEKIGKPACSLTISIGRDPRLSGPSLKQAAVEAMRFCGVKVLDCGLASTPAMFMSTVFPEFCCDGAIMITASHLPYNRNGFKYFDKNGGLDKKDISEIISYAETYEEQTDKGLEQGIRRRSEGKYVSERGGARAGEDKCASGDRREGEDESGGDGANSVDSKSSVDGADLMKAYCGYIKDIIKRNVNSKTDFERPLVGLKIVVDAGNGSGGFFALDILAPLGADISGSQFLAPDGTFPNHVPNPEDKTAMEHISAAVMKNRADLGLIFDTDVDRSAAVDKHGREISRNRIVALAAALVAQDHPKTTIVTDSITSDQLSVFLTDKLGLLHHRFRRGYRNVINEAIRLNREGTDCQLAIETSGHAAYKENYFLDDGAYLAAKIVIKAAKLHSEGTIEGAAAGKPEGKPNGISEGKPDGKSEGKPDGKSLDSLISGLVESAEAGEIRLPIAAADFSAYADGILEDLRIYAEGHPGMTVVTPNYEGVRISFDKEHGDGWCMLRKSLHDPVMPLNIESNTNGGYEKILQLLKPVLKC